MTVEESRKIIQNKFPKLFIRNEKEYSKYFLFEMVSEKYKDTDTMVFDSTFLVSKEDGEVQIFHPALLGDDDKPKVSPLLARLKK